MKKLIGLFNDQPKHQRIGCGLVLAGVAAFGLFILSQAGWILSNLFVVIGWWLGEPIGIKLLTISFPLLIVGAGYFYVMYDN